MTSPPSAGNADPVFALAPRVLVVDDDVNLMLLLTLHLEEAGFGVHAAANCRQAMALRPHDFQMALVDYQLPDGNGLQILNHLMAAAPALPVVMMSACHDRSLADKARALGARAFLRKSLRLADVVGALTHAGANGPVMSIPACRAHQADPDST